jgi:hypothetical protein
VEDPEGERFSDGRRYRKYYVPIAHLQLLPALSTGLPNML